MCFLKLWSIPCNQLLKILAIVLGGYKFDGCPLPCNHLDGCPYGTRKLTVTLCATSFASSDLRRVSGRLRYFHLQKSFGCSWTWWCPEGCIFTSIIFSVIYLLLTCVLVSITYIFCWCHNTVYTVGMCTVANSPKCWTHNWLHNIWKCMVAPMCGFGN